MLDRFISVILKLKTVIVDYEPINQQNCSPVNPSQNLATKKSLVQPVLT